MSYSHNQKQRTIISLLSTTWTFIGLKQRRQLYLLLVLTFISSFTEAVSLGAAFPFISILTEPDKLFSSPMMANVVHWLGIKSAANLIFPLALAFAISALLAGVLRLLLMWTNIKLGNAIGTDLGVDIYRKTLYQPYSVHVMRSSSEIITGITQKTSAATGIIVSVVTFMTSLALFSAIMATLIFINPIATIIAIVSFGTAYGIIGWKSRKRLIRNSQIIAHQQTDVMKSLQEGLGAIRDVLLDGAQEEYSSVYSCAALKQQRAKT